MVTRTKVQQPRSHNQSAFLIAAQHILLLQKMVSCCYILNSVWKKIILLPFAYSPPGLVLYHAKIRWNGGFKELLDSRYNNCLSCTQQTKLWCLYLTLSLLPSCYLTASELERNCSFPAVFLLPWKHHIQTATLNDPWEAFSGDLFMTEKIGSPVFASYCTSLALGL